MLFTIIPEDFQWPGLDITYIYKTRTQSSDPGDLLVFFFFSSFSVRIIRPVSRLLTATVVYVAEVGDSILEYGMIFCAALFKIKHFLLSNEYFKGVFVVCFL